MGNSNIKERAMNARPRALSGRGRVYLPVGAVATPLS